MKINTFLTTISNFYKNNSKIIKIVFIVTLILVLIISIKSCSDYKKQSNIEKNTNLSLSREYKIKVDELGRQQVTIKDLTTSKNILEKSNEEVKNYYTQKIDSFAKILNKKDKDILGYITLISKTEGKGTGDFIITKDSSKKENQINISSSDSVVAFKSNDGWLQYFGSTTLKSKKYEYNYTYIDTINSVKNITRKGLFNLTKETNWTFFSSNPNAKIIFIDQADFTYKKNKHWVLSIGTSAGMNDQFKIRWVPVSLTLGYKILEF